jgi:hypothetical protein
MMIVLEFFAHNYSYSKQETMQLTIPEALFFLYPNYKERETKSTGSGNRVGDTISNSYKPTSKEYR